MKKLFCLIGLLVLVSPARGVYVVRISDLQYSPTPPNPIRVAGRVVSEDPLKLTDGRGELPVTGITGKMGDFMVVEGDYADGVLSASQQHQKATLFAAATSTEMIYIPAGSFLMGNNGAEPYSEDEEFPQHSVYLSGYWIGKYEVTRGEYGRFMEAGGYSNPAYWSSDGWNWKVSNNRTEPRYWAAVQDWGTGIFTQTDSHPVVGVTYYEAEAYCAWEGGHLPTEAQWEKAARWTGSYPNVYPWGNVWDAEKCNNYDDHNPAGGGSQKYQTAPVGSYPSDASPYGCQDMAGNVVEWCRDWFDFTYYSVSPSVDPQGPSSGSSRVLRGGDWGGDYVDARCVGRGANYPAYIFLDTSLGFRVAR